MRLLPGRPGGDAAPSLDTEADARLAYEAHGGELYRFALRATGDEASSQDIVQEVFLRAWRSADRFDPGLASLRVWLFAIARNVLVDHHRWVGARPWLRGLTDRPADVEAPTADPADRLVREWVVEEALDRIGEEHRNALTETYLRDRPYAEVAAEEGIPVGTLRSRVFYGLKALRAVLDDGGDPVTEQDMVDCGNPRAPTCWGTSTRPSRPPSASTFAGARTAGPSWPNFSRSPTPWPTRVDARSPALPRRRRCMPGWTPSLPPRGAGDAGPGWSARWAGWPRPPSSSSSWCSATPGSPAPPAPVQEAVSVQVPPSQSGVTATAGLINHTWGTEVKLVETGLPAGGVYSAYVVMTDGTEVPAGTFVGIGAGPVTCNLQSFVLRDRAQRFEVRDRQGGVVIRSTF